MRMPPKSPDMESARENLHRDIVEIEKLSLGSVDVLAQSGIADKRWCAIARTHFEEGAMALHRALRDFPGDDPNQYGKTENVHQMPPTFTPPVDPEGKRVTGSVPKVEWSNYDADGNLKPDSDT